MPETVKIVIARHNGGYTFIEDCFNRYNALRKEHGYQPLLASCLSDLPRDDPLLVQAVTEFQNPHLAIREIPIAYKNSYVIREIDGYEDIICDPYRYVGKSIEMTDVSEMSKSDMRSYLEHLKTFLK